MHTNQWIPMERGLSRRGPLAVAVSFQISWGGVLSKEKQDQLNRSGQIQATCLRITLLGDL